MCCNENEKRKEDTMKFEKLSTIILNEIQTNKKEVDTTSYLQVDLKVQVDKSGLVYVYDEKNEKWFLISKNYLNETSSKHFTDEQLIDHLTAFVEKSIEDGEYPSLSKYKKLYDNPSRESYLRRFKTWEQALQKTGLYESITTYLVNTYDTETHPSMKRYSKEELLTCLQEFIEENPKQLTIEKFLKREKKPALDTYKRHFGSWENALKIAVKQVENKKKIS